MTRMRNFHLLVVIAALAVASASCGDVVRQSKAPVFLVIDSLVGQAGGSSGDKGNPLLSDVLTKGSVFNDNAEVALRIVSKDVAGLAAPSTNNQVTITRYRVVYKRADGRNTPGVDVPYPFD